MRTLQALLVASVIAVIGSYVAVLPPQHPPVPHPLAPPDLGARANSPYRSFTISRTAAASVVMVLIVRSIKKS